MAQPESPVPRPAAGARNVADGLEQLRLTSGSGLTVNVFVARGHRGVGAIDLGFTTTTDNLVAALESISLRPDDLDGVLYTHTHEDHMGGGIALRDLLPGASFVWRGTSNVFDDNWYNFYERLGRWDAWVEELLPEGPQKEAILLARAARRPSRFRTTGDGTLRNPTAVEFGETVSIAGLDLVCLDARGHDPFHVAWFEPNRRWLFSGDVLLTSPTPLMPPLRDDLATYRHTLLRWGRLEGVELVLPGHGRPMTDLGAAVRRSLGFVEQLWNAVAAALSGADAVDPGQLAMAMLADADPRGAYVALANVHSQLSELRDLGLATVRDDRRWVRTRTIPEFSSRLG